MKTTNKIKTHITNWFAKILIVLLIIYSVLITYLYTNKRSVSSSFYKTQAKEIVDNFSSKTNAVGIVNQIDNFAYGGEHALPEGGGGWCVYKKDNKEWTRLFCSQDEKWCGLYKNYGLPEGLIGDCKQENDPKFLD